MLTPDIAPRIHEYIAGIVRTISGTPVIVGGTDDHVHVLACLDKTSALSDILRIIKSNSSKWMHETYPEMKDFAWQEGYGAFTVSVTGIDQIRRYIEKQLAHHRTVTFQEEFLEFLARHNIPYDDRYIWK